MVVEKGDPEKQWQDQPQQGHHTYQEGDPSTGVRVALAGDPRHPEDQDGDTVRIGTQPRRLNPVQVVLVVESKGSIQKPGEEDQPDCQATRLRQSQAQTLA